MDRNVDDLRYIRSTMERSTKFLSLSGISGVVAGLVALCGAYLAYLIMRGELSVTGIVLFDLLILAAIVLVTACSVGVYFSMRKAKKTGAKFWTPVTFQLIKDAGLPLVTGGLFSLILVYNGYFGMTAATMLIFYGIALVNAGAKTYDDIKILGFCEIVLGLLAGILIGNGLLLWAIGFGVLHIVYGIVMYMKYDAKSDKANG
ncbi:hypothetical protein CLV62_10175 [Dysgonomonas alginatilytica]|uniref:Uncharacterized protein n=1 Tax=Dysgonomonas alginatilytica TaxID=1605892 RepID=A0A2V3PVG5_9BACT|nr:hypothetical protein [Dysgonomonas alginatilytica]PXV68811.1 hypothetical protein CLV62_10175 [Dysgonomonas alginatilytica]